jgi:hypothetical protein
MQRNANLGMSLGQMLSGAFDGSAKQKGVLDGTRINQMNADIGYKNAEADAKRQEVESRSDPSLIKSLVAGMQNGINGDNVANDFNAYLDGSYKPREQQGPAMAPGSYMPAPEYVSKFPELQQKFSGLKQMLAIGDKNLSNLPKALQGEQRNNITKDLATATPEQAAVIGQRTAAIEGNVNPLEMQKAALVYGLTHGNNSPDSQNALLLSQGKTRFDNMGGTGTFDLLTGLQSLNELGQSGVLENKAQANQANAGANENNAQANLAGVRSKNIKEGKGDGSAAAQSKDFAQLRDDMRADFNAQYPINSMTGTRKGAPAFADFQKSWLKQYNINENDFFRAGNVNQEPTAPPKAKSNPAYQEYLDAYKKYANDPVKQKALTEYARKKGIVK